MNRQRGQIALYGALAAGAVVLAMGIALKVMSARLDACKQEYATFQAQVKANGKIALAAKAKKEAEDKLAKEKYDADYKKLAGERNALAVQLRNARAAGGILPQSPAGSASPDRACFDRSLLESALQRLDAGVSGLVAEGDTLGIRLKFAREWAVKP